MAIAVTILPWVLGIAFGLLVLAMVLPLRLELLLTKADVWQFRAALRPFGRFGPRIAMSGGEKKPQVAAAKARPSRKNRKARRASPQHLAKAAVRFAVDFIKLVHISKAKLEMRFGLGDPGDTGQVFGLLSPLIYGTPAGPDIRMRIEPDFDDIVLSGRAELDLSLVPAALLGPLIRLGWVVLWPAK